MTNFFYKKEYYNYSLMQISIKIKLDSRNRTIYSYRRIKSSKKDAKKKFAHVLVSSSFIKFKNSSTSFFEHM